MADAVITETGGQVEEDAVVVLSEEERAARRAAFREWLMRPLPVLSNVSVRDEHGNYPPWKWVPNDRWKKLQGILYRPDDTPDSTYEARAAERAYERKKDAELLE